MLAVLDVSIYVPVLYVRLMSLPENCAVIIPCRNEERFIGPIVAETRRRLPEIFVVDDGSTDGTANLAENAGATVLRHGNTRGKGAALQTGWKHARSSGFRWALCMDGDGQHLPADIPKFLSCAERTGARLIVGNRMPAAAQMPWLRRAVNRWMSARISKLAGRPLPDSQCGFRLMNLDAWAALRIRASHFEIESDTLLAFALGGWRIEFVPIRVVYGNERSKIHPLRDTARWFHWRWRVAGKIPAAGGRRSSAAALTR